MGRAKKKRKEEDQTTTTQQQPRSSAHGNVKAQQRKWAAMWMKEWAAASIVVVLIALFANKIWDQSDKEGNTAAEPTAVETIAAETIPFAGPSSTTTCDATALKSMVHAVGGWVHPALELHEGRNGRGWFASVHISKGESLIRVPDAATVNSRDHVATASVKNPDHRVAANLLAEVARGASSPKAAALVCLPKECPSALCWTDQELAALGDPTFEQKGKEARVDAEHIWRRMDWTKLGWDTPPRLELWLWAVGMSISRSFPAPTQGAPRMGIFDAKLMGDDTVAFATAMDMANHQPGSGKPIRRKSPEHGWLSELKAYKDMEPGDEIFIEYDTVSIYQMTFGWGIVQDHPIHAWFYYEIDIEKAVNGAKPHCTADTTKKLLEHAGAVVGPETAVFHVGRPLPPAGLAPFRALIVLSGAPKLAKNSLSRDLTKPLPNKQMEYAAQKTMRKILETESAKPAYSEAGADTKRFAGSRWGTISEYRTVSTTVLQRILSTLDAMETPTVASHTSQ